ncbi:biotin/lipoyl-containing protein, partial [Kitasatospora sp. NPDC058444]|uniref:biotin/lipoyl-containing protein n=1 Tax=Kitasatospora sp. NPDC058444 TaxID=3346504 RepID=UPI0036612B30
ERANRALAEFKVEGMATAIPFHQAVVTDPAFTSDPFTVHTRWIETEFDNTIPPFTLPADTDADEEPGRESVVVEVDGKRLEISLPTSLSLGTGPSRRTGPATVRPKRRGAAMSSPAASGDCLASPMQGTIVKIAVEEGQEIKEGDLVVVLEAMKMEQPLNAHRSGTVQGLAVEIGASLTAGATVCEIKD